MQPNRGGCRWFRGNFRLLQLLKTLILSWDWGICRLVSWNLFILHLGALLLPLFLGSKTQQQKKIRCIRRLQHAISEFFWQLLQLLQDPPGTTKNHRPTFRAAQALETQKHIVTSPFRAQSQRQQEKKGILNLSISEDWSFKASVGNAVDQSTTQGRENAPPLRGPSLVIPQKAGNLRQTLQEPLRLAMRLLEFFQSYHRFSPTKITVLRPVKPLSRGHSTVRKKKPANLPPFWRFLLRNWGS